MVYPTTDINFPSGEKHVFHTCISIVIKMYNLHIHSFVFMTHN